VAGESEKPAEDSRERSAVPADSLDEHRRRASERLATIGQLAASIGHELRNPLSVMESSLFLARRQLAHLQVADAHLEQHLDKIAAEIRRSRKTIEDLLDLARSQPPRRQRVALARVVEAALARTLPPAVGVTVDVADVMVDADPDQLAQVLMNLLLNAEEALSGVGQVLVRGERGDAVTLLRVRDDGPGVPPALRPRLFEPLFTTKPRGTGLGLALCRSMIEAHGGTLVLEPTAVGASFLVTLPDA
jgi:signal transduction histidine kinase